MIIDMVNQQLSDLVQFYLETHSCAQDPWIVSLTTAQAVELAGSILLLASDVPFDTFYSFVSVTPTGKHRVSVVNPKAAKRGNKKGEKRKSRKNSKNSKVTESPSYEQVPLPHHVLEVGAIAEVAHCPVCGGVVSEGVEICKSCVDGGIISLLL